MENERNRQGDDFSAASPKPRGGPQGLTESLPEKESGSLEPAPAAKRRRPSHAALNAMSGLIGVALLIAGIWWVFHTIEVDREVPYFAIPLVLCFPVIAAVTFRALWED